MNRDSYNYHPPSSVEPALNTYGYRNQIGSIKNNPSTEPMPSQSIPPIYPNSSVAPQFSYYPPSMANDPYEAQNYNPKYIGGYQEQAPYWRGYEAGPVHSHLPPPPLAPPPPSFSQPPQNTQPNIVQKISLMIQSQLPHLRSIMNRAIPSSGKAEQRRRLRSSSSSGSRSRSRDKHRDPEDSGWLCHKCSFPNYQWRNRCRKCNQSREFRRSTSNKLKEWKCPSCQNLNYARRKECNRCGKSKSFQD